jgi:hypothetical protein
VKKLVFLFSALAAYSCSESNEEPNIPAPEAKYKYSAPAAGEIASSLRADTWKNHFLDDLRPFWIMPEAAGAPEGNFPSFRGMDGTIQGSSERYPRMIARQTYAYSMGYLLTGEPRLLELAHAGMEWLREHALDPRGGCHAKLDNTGAPIEGAKTAQDTAYCALGFAAYTFVTRDAQAEAALHQLRDVLFDPAIFWDAGKKLIKDGKTADLSADFDVEGDGGSELVAQLDAINGFLLLAQPVLRDEARREQYLGDLETLAHSLIDTYFSEGIFWGVDTNKGRFGSKHVDFGHTLKSYWMVLQVDKRLAEAPFHDFLAANIHTWVDRAYDDTNGRWAKRPSSELSNEYGSDWWIYAEADQLAATLDLADSRYRELRTQTQEHWLTDYVDRERPVREVISGIRRDGSVVFDWPDTDTAKCNMWKSGFHSVEHALVGYLAGTHAEGIEAELHFAVAEADVETFVARPYSLDGREISRAPEENVAVAGETLRHVRVRFDQLY